MVDSLSGQRTGDAMPGRRCRACDAADLRLVVDLGRQPPAEQFIAADVAADAAADADRRFPLVILVCTQCWLVQLDGDPIAADDEPGGLAFSVSSTMRAHIDGLVTGAIAAAAVGPDSRVVETASHGNRLHEVFRAHGISSVLIEPTEAYADDARRAGVPVLVERLVPETADRLRKDDGPADLYVDAFHLAHDATLREYLAGVARLLAPEGLAVFEFDHLLPVVAETQYDGFRHGHASYLSLSAAQVALARAGLEIVDALRTPAYGGSLRVFVRHPGVAPVAPRVATVVAAEREAGLTGVDAFRAFALRVEESRAAIRAFLDDRRRAGELVVAYGAPSRGNTLLNSSGVTRDDIAWTVDRAPSKQGRFLPGSRIPIYPPERVAAARPDFLFILTWDLRDEIVAQMANIRDWGGRFVVPLPTLRIVD